MEIWKDIEGYEGFYQVSNLGAVKSLKRRKRTGNGSIDIIIKERMLTIDYKREKKGYGSICLYSQSGKKRFLVHVLVAKTFIPNPENKPQVNHINGIKKDNSVKNLEWVTQSQNMKHAFLLGLNKGIKGKPKYHFRKLSFESAQQIRTEYKNGVSQGALSIRFGVKQQLISSIITYKTYKVS